MLKFPVGISLQKEGAMRKSEDITKMFEEIDEDGRMYVLAVLRKEHERTAQSRRPRLRLVPSNNAASSLADSKVNPLSITRAG